MKRIAFLLLASVSAAFAQGTTVAIKPAAVAAAPAA